MSVKKNNNTWRWLWLLLLLPTTACISQINNDGDPSIPRNAIVIEVVANTGLSPWLETAVTNFNDSRTETAGGDPVFVALDFLDSGAAVSRFDDGTALPALWLPDEVVWTHIAADNGVGQYRDDCLSVAESPLVIAMWRPLAESLGWPGRDIGWLDVGSLAADPSAWAYYSGGQFGDVLRLGHTHPGLSATGANTLLAIVQAAESKSSAVTVEEIGQPIVQASVSAFEGSVTWFSSSTSSLGAAMSERGDSFLGAAIMYESTVLAQNNPELIPIYPFEGTFFADHPACLNREASAELAEGARIFRDYLVSDEAQITAVAQGLRPVANVPLTAPLDAAHGVELDQPQIIFASPGVETVYAAQALWQSARKDVNLVMLLDTSGSMSGDKMEGMREAALQFVDQMGDDDFLTLIAFSTEPEVIVFHEPIGAARGQIREAIQNLVAVGDTTLFDAIGDGAQIIASTNQPDTANAMVVLTDGNDTRSYRYSFDQSLVNRAIANGTTVFTIAYGEDADEGTLRILAEEANGNYFQGDEANIAAIYEELSAAFGGSVGIGR